VGGPLVGVEYKLQDVPDLNYTKLSQPFPTGEVCIRGPPVFKGYFRNKLLTDDSIDEDGWLHTGDIGELGIGNSLRIIDRKKNIFKLSQGEYIVPEKLERAYEQSKYIAQVFIHGDSFKNHIVAIIFLEILQIRPFCEANGINAQGMESMIKTKEVNDLIRDELASIAKTNNFNSLEKIGDNFRLVPEEFQVGLVMTPTLKIMRQKAKEHFKELIDEMYA